MRKILISGGDGALAQELFEQYEDFDVIWMPDKAEMDIRNRNEVREAIEEFKPTLFIHPAAITRPMKRHVEDPALSIDTNIIGTANVCLECMERNIKLVYISTDYVYPGYFGKYSEDDFLKPINNYAWTKLGGECALQLYDNSLILRVCMTKRPFDHEKALIDSTRSLMYIDEAAGIILKLLDETGIINVGGPASTCYDFARKERPSVGHIYREDIDEPIAYDSSMDTSKMRKLIK